jgi:ATP-binding cassette subfamily B (MDR/TAP) protein 1
MCASSHKAVNNDTLKQEHQTGKFSELLFFVDTPKAKLALRIGVIAAMFNGLVFPALAVVFSMSFASMESLSPSKISQTAGIYVGIGLYAFVVSSIQNICFDYVSNISCNTFRLRWFGALLRQDAAFFDVNNVSGFASSIEPNAQTVKRGLGKKFGEGIQFTVTSIGGIFIALFMSWRVALLVLSIVPLLSCCAFIVIRINQSQTESQNKAYSKAGSVAYQTVSSIRTVFALNAVPEMIKVYAEATQDAYNQAIRPLLKVGIVNGEPKPLIFFTIIISFVDSISNFSSRCIGGYVYRSSMSFNTLRRFTSLQRCAQEWM